MNIKKFCVKLLESKFVLYSLLLISFASAIYSFKNSFDLLGKVLQGADLLATIIAIFLYLGCGLLFLTRRGIYAIVILGIIGMTVVNRASIYEALIYLLPGALLPDLIAAADFSPKRKRY